MIAGTSTPALALRAIAVAVSLAISAGASAETRPQKVAEKTTTLGLNCWVAAAYRYQLPVELLYSIGSVESGHKPHIISAPNKNGTVDIGLMQINETWLPVLKQYGITRKDLIEKPCTNIQVGAWILAQEVARTGYTWYSIGAYNAGPITSKTSAKSRERKIATYRVYAGKVLAHWKRLAETRKPIEGSEVASAGR